ncbi:hypothetical protein HUN41_00163 [Streptomyces phage Coruscant]|uniref:Uncharacterized protein n=1 Tax=Streptomyces phage Coruscant TaxID=2739834 RepID=A0A7G4AW79_9CAUD|nr:hypothetical protein PP454_gp148 [Streptomyces phage Coruscant]QMP84269.1 hypothetical protein HUN41_00163 [Streptomyces phage Coruscant]
MNRFICVDCPLNTSDIGKYYMVTNIIWQLFGAGNRMLCISCLECRMGRKLNKQDFAKVPVNYLGYRSERMINRLEN